MIVTIEGVTPLVVSQFGERAATMIADGQEQKAKQKKAARDPKAEFLDALYIISGDPTKDLSKCKFGFPAGGIKKALVYAGRYTDQKMTHLRGAINVVGDLLEINSPKLPTMRSDRVVLNRGKTSLAYRPNFYPWTIEVPVIFNRAVLSEEQLLNLFQNAGFSVGIGAWRTECNGIMGQFKIGKASKTTN